MHISDIKLTPNRKRFVELANSEGFDVKISRKDITILQAKYGIKMPYWLTRNLIFRYEKGVYWLPIISPISFVEINEKFEDEIF